MATLAHHFEEGGWGMYPILFWQIIAIDADHIDEVTVSHQRARHILGLIDDIGAGFVGWISVAAFTKVGVVENQDALLGKAVRALAGPFRRSVRVVGHGRTY